MMDPHVMVTDLAGFAELIKRRCGLSFEAEKRPLLEAAVRERMAATRQAATAAYFAQLKASDREFLELVSLLTINETYFFREPQQLTLLTERLMPRLLARPGRPLPLRVLSAGCSTGEEPYSIMMAARERYGIGASQVLNVIGCDIDRQALARARLATYKEFSFRGVPQELRDRYFTRIGGDYTLGPAGREGVDFMAVNLLDEVDPIVTGRFDVIFLRNVTIYFDQPTRRDIQRRLSSLLAEGGCLLVGMAETLANDFGVLQLVQEDGIFYFTRDGVGLPVVPSAAGTWMATGRDSPPPPVPALVSPSGAEPLSAAPPVSPTRPPLVNPASVDPPPVHPPVVAVAESPLLDQARQLTWERSYDRALALLEALTGEGGRAGHGDSHPWLLKAHIFLNRKEFAAAIAVAEQVLVTEPWSIDAFLVLGLSARYTEKTDQALEWFKRAVYASHACWPAHYHLGDLHRVLGELELARSAYGVALRLLGSVSGFDTGIKVLLPAFPASDIRFLCEHQLARLGGPPSVAASRRRIRT